MGNITVGSGRTLALLALVCLIVVSACASLGCAAESEDEELSALEVTSSGVKPTEYIMEPRVGPGTSERLVVLATVTNTSSDITVTDRDVIAKVRNQNNKVIETQSRSTGTLGPGQESKLSFKFEEVSKCLFFAEQMSYEFSFR